jgi:hypothetical protein
MHYLHNHFVLSTFSTTCQDSFHFFSRPTATRLRVCGVPTIADPGQANCDWTEVVISFERPVADRAGPPTREVAASLTFPGHPLRVTTHPSPTAQLTRTSTHGTGNSSQFICGPNSG